MEEPNRRTVTGSYRPDESQIGEVPPEQGFGKAIKDALDKIADGYDGNPGWGPGPFEVTMTFEATVKVVNPGQIGDYRVVVSG